MSPGRPRILTIDDSKTSADMLRMTWSKTGYVVLQEPDGQGRPLRVMSRERVA